MTKIYVLTNEPRSYDDQRYNIGVFSTQQKALEYIKIHYTEYVHCTNATYGKSSYDIEEYTLDEC